MRQKNKPICQKAYGCIHVKVGYETDVARMIATIYPEVEAYAILRIKHRRCNGVRSYSNDVMVPGYILFFANVDTQVSKFLTVANVNSVLKYDECDWHLRGDDLLFSEWIFKNEGLIGVSSAFMENDKIKIIDGPLKQIEGKIIRINKRSRNAQVILGFKQQDFNVWLPFEWIEKKVVRDTVHRKNSNQTISARSPCALESILT